MPTSRRVSSSHAAAAWTPASLSGLFAWFKGDVGVTSSGGAVSNWADQSGNGRDVSQSTAGNKPSTGTQTINSINLIDSYTAGPTGRYLDNGSFSLSQAFTVYAVVKIPNFSGFPVLFDNTSGSAVSVYWGDTGAGQKATLASTSNADTTRAAVANTAIQIVAVFNGSSSAYYENGTQYGGALNPGSTGLSSLRIGNSRGAGAAYGLYVGEIVFQSGAASSTDRSNWNTYCTSRWGL